MNNELLDKYWQSIPIGKDNAVDYAALCAVWEVSERTVRRFLHELSKYDNGDNYILMRSSKNKGFYRTDDHDEITAYRNECLNRGRNVFAPLRKCSRVLNTGSMQMSITNNLYSCRAAKGLKQTDVVAHLFLQGFTIDCAMLSKFENSRALPMPDLLQAIADIYECEAHDLIDLNLFGAVS